MTVLRLSRIRWSICY